jgi:hypothetical protein
MMAYCDTEKWAQLGLDLVKIARTLKSNIKYKCFEWSKVLNIKKTKQKLSHFIHPETWREQQEIANNLKILSSCVLSLYFNHLFKMLKSYKNQWRGKPYVSVQTVFREILKESSKLFNINANLKR